MNWREQKPNCFCLNHWPKDFIELISMERAASVLQGLYRDELNGAWTLIKEYINVRDTVKFKNDC